ncbi:MAG: DUF1080 domain-containing protein [Phycisphaera sp.]|nr:DUF1080 domain-containing protein [Phycisphaera sp.]
MKTALTATSLTLLLTTAALLAADDTPTTRVLFDGKSLDGWEFTEGGWVLEPDGSMTCRNTKVKDKKGNETERPISNIWAAGTYGDFVLTLQYKLSEGANSGVFYRSNPADPVNGGFEIQLMDNVGFQKTHGQKDAKKLNGSFYDCKEPSCDPQNPIGEWNFLFLYCKGPEIALKINGQQTFSVNVNDWDTAGKNPDGTTNKFKTAMKDLPRVGRIGFQNHGQKVWFKDVKIIELK